jgi:hypothetical protein
MKEMTTQEIIRNSDEAKESKVDWKKLYAAVYMTVKQNTHRILRHGNTLAWLELLPDDSAQMFIFNADTPKNFIINIKEFAKAMRNAGFKSYFGETYNPQTFEILRRFGYRVEIEKIKTDNQGRAIYRGVVNV